MTKEVFNEEELENQLEIDENNLDRQGRVQPKLVFKFSKFCAIAQKEVDLAENELKVVAAILDKKIRESPDIYGLEKVTETGINNATIRNKKYKEAKESLVEKRYNLNLVQGALEAVKSRGFSLSFFEELVKQNYIAYNRKESNSNIPTSDGGMGIRKRK